MPLKLDHLPPAVASRLKAFHRRKRLFQFLRALFATTVVYLALALAAMHLDRFLFLDEGARIRIFWAVHATAGGFGLAFLAFFLTRRSQVSQVAYDLESKLPSAVEERFVTLDNVLARGGLEDNPIAKELVQELEESTVQYSQTFDAAKLVQDKPLRLLAGVLVALGALYTCLTCAPSYEFPLMVRRFLFPRGGIPKPSFIKVSVRPEQIVIGKGGEAVIQAEISGQIPAPFKWLMKQLGAAPSRCVIAVQPEIRKKFDFKEAAKSDMNRLLRDTFLFTKGDLQESFRYQVRCGDGETRVLLAEVVAQPIILDVQLDADPPAYSGLPHETITHFRQPLQFLPGTRVKISFRSDQAVSNPSLQFERAKQPVLAEWDENTLSASYEFILKEKVEFQITAVNSRGFAAVDRPRLILGLREDAAPVVRLEWPPSDLEKVPSELVSMQGTVEDDLGLAELALRFVLNPSPEEENVPKEIALPLEIPGQKKISLSALLDLEKTRAGPGDLVSVRVRARDTAGNDSLSREISIRLVSFTRGENERRRLRILQFVRDALAEIAAAAPSPEGPAAPEATAIDTLLYEKLTKLAAAIDLPLAAEPSLTSVLDLLEMEHHLTDGPQNKEDLRKLIAAVQFAAAPFSPREPVDPFAFRSLRLREIAQDILPGLLQYRQFKNMTWRLFGMRYEAERIREKLLELAQSKDPELDRASSMKRRAELYLKTLQDLGDELIECSRKGPAGPDPEKVKPLIGDLNTAGYYMGRGALAKRQASSEEVAELIPLALAEIRSAFPALLEQECLARKKLDRVYEEILARIPAAPSPDDNPVTARSRALAWLAADARLMDRNPFCPYWPRFVTFALEGVWDTLKRPAADSSDAEGPAERRAAAEALLHPAGSLHDAAALEEAWAWKMALEWHIASLLNLPGISNTEKLLEMTLLFLEREAPDAASGRREFWEEEVGRLQGIDLSQEIPAAQVRHLQDSLSSRHLFLPSLKPAAQVLAEAARPPLLLNSPEDQLESLAGHLEQSLADLEETSKALKTEDSEEVGKRLTFASASVSEASKGIRDILCPLLLRVGMLPPGDAQARKDEVLLLKVREASGRYHSRAALHLQALQTRPAGPINPGDLAKLSADLAALKTIQESLRQHLKNLLEASRDGSLLKEEELSRLVLLKEFDRTRRLTEASLAIIEAKDEARTAQNFLDEFPAAAASFLQAHRGLIDSAEAALAEAKALLASPGKSADSVEQKIGDARARLEELNAAMERSAAEESFARFGSSLAQVLNKTARLSRRGDPQDVRDVQSRRYILEEVLVDLKRLGNQIQDDAALEQESESSFRGGPEDLWSKTSRNQAETSRQRLLDQARYAWQASSLGVLEGLKKEPARHRYDAGYAWSCFLYRLARSSLSGTSGVRPAQSGEEKAGDPHLKFLRAELEKARKVKELKNYAEPTKEYLDSLSDFLRY